MLRPEVVHFSTAIHPIFGALFDRELHLRGPRGRTALMTAAENENIDSARILIAHGADLEMTDKSGRKAWELVPPSPRADDLRELLGAPASKQEEPVADVRPTERPIKPARQNPRQGSRSTDPAPLPVETPRPGLSEAERRRQGETARQQKELDAARRRANTARSGARSSKLGALNDVALLPFDQLLEESRRLEAAGDLRAAIEAAQEAEKGYNMIKKAVNLPFPR